MLGTFRHIDYALERWARRRYKALHRRKRAGAGWLNKMQAAAPRLFPSTAANTSDVTETHALLHGEESCVFADAGYLRAGKRPENQDIGLDWYVAARPSTVTRMYESLQACARRLEHLKSSVRSKVEHPFRVIKRQFGCTKVRYRSLTQNTAQVKTLFALSNLWMVRRDLMRAMGYVRSQRARWPREKPESGQID